MGFGEVDSGLGLYLFLRSKRLILVAGHEEAPYTGIWELGLLRRAPHYPVFRVSKTGRSDPWPLLWRRRRSLQGSSPCETNLQQPPPQKGTNLWPQRPSIVAHFFLMVVIVAFCFVFVLGEEGRWREAAVWERAAKEAGEGV